MTRKSKQLRGIISLALALVLLTCTMATTAFAADFSDVAQGAWYHEAVDFVSDEGLMAGVGGGRFEPNTSMTRGMLVTVLHRLEGTPAPTANSSFSDVAGGAYYAQAVTWAAENGIVAGIGNNQFAPNSLMTRQQFATILYRYAQYKGYDVTNQAELSGFADANTVGSYAVDALRWAVGNGIVNGNGSNLMPAGSATRAQAAAMLMRFVQNIVPSQPETPAEPETPAQPTGEQRMRITVGDQVIYATLADNETAHAIAQRLPMTVTLLDLYGREMCYRFADEMPANEVQTRNFELGEIIYWPPRHSFVIMYRQDGEQFSMQHVGQLDNVQDVSLFGQGDVTVTFELVQD